MDNLTPCPFCGHDDPLTFYFKNSGLWAVWCKCQATGPSGLSEKEAIDKWNVRSFEVIRKVFSGSENNGLS